MANTNPSLKELRNFGLTFAVFLIFFTQFILNYVFELHIGWWPFYVSITIIIVSLIIPQLLMLLYLPWMKLAYILHFINTHIIIAVIFYFIITPTGLIMRLIGKNPMKSDKSISSYRISSAARNKNHIERPY